MERGLTFDDVCLVPVYNDMDSRAEADLSTRLTFTRRMALPILCANMDSVIGPELAEVIVGYGGVPIFHRFADLETVKVWVEKFPACFLSVGLKMSPALLDLILDNAELGVCLDVANAHTRSACKAVEAIAERGVDVIAGNVCTAQGYIDLVNAGANAVKVGIGPGAACLTRRVSGYGSPQFTAICDVAEVRRKYKVPCIADGGVRSSGDVVKALAAGADAVMIGKLFACVEESSAEKRGDTKEEVDYMLSNMARPGSMLSFPQPREAKYRGQASEEFQLEYFGKVKNGVPEGESMWAPVTGSAKDLIERLLGGLRSGMTYGGARTIEELQKKAKFLKVADTSYALESNVRG